MVWGRVVPPVSAQRPSDEKAAFLTAFSGRLVAALVELEQVDRLDLGVVARAGGGERAGGVGAARLERLDHLFLRDSRRLGQLRDRRLTAVLRGQPL